MSDTLKEKIMTSTENYSRPSFTGTWTYRSFNNDPDPNNDAAWFVAEMELEHLQSGELHGKLKGGDPKYVYELTGYVDENCTTEKTPSSWWDQRLIIVLKANGATPETNGHEYEYRGYYPEFWPNGKDQVPTFVGSVIRAKRPDDTSLEGKVGSFIAIKKP
jgi:hypothetical protein